MKKMEKIPTAEEHYKSIVGCTPNEIDQHPCTTEAMISFAKLHVQAALRDACLQGSICESRRIWEVTEKEIMSAYPLENIK